MDRHQILLEEVAWTLREHSTKAKQQVSRDYYLILEISCEENLTDSGKLANSWKVSWSKKIWKQKANTNNEDIKQMKMPNEGKMKNPNMAK